ncbi:MAG: SRPBCC domain-containing protein [Alphaproteobacteria bacterium]|nr:SRPBCC domain-containing protein [Alphaproteobacteria bacterium]MBL6936895.1 SRPBCC domain-containing protein [Alphaproteobacteria bacterium]MBL7097664.1 SRPBCC domain-containing protein [Alphaproteobacteria bacterium]
MHQVLHAALGLAVASALAGGAAHAAVASSATNGFSVVETVHIAAAPDKVWAELVAPSHWWNPAHTFSKSAANLTLDPRAGGCWCEKLPDGGSVQHMIVFRFMPNSQLVLRGPLGPLQGLGVDGAMTVVLKPGAGGTDLTVTYDVGGYLKDGLAGLAGPVDGVLGEQFNRLKSQMETGSPEAKEH